ncbi:MAG: hypothetical protein QM817_38425 [Archangium sp.]
MAHGPLVVMTRASGERGWTVRVDPLVVKLDDTVLKAKGARVEVVRPDGKTSHANTGEPFKVGALDVVCFRAEEQERAVPSAKAMSAIQSVRASDSEDARRVLGDVLEESGALAEAEYVRLELKLQAAKAQSLDDAFIEGVKQLRVLSSVVGPTFRYLVGRDIDGCSGVRWAFRCPASWDSMKATANASERVCTSCRQLVVQVSNEQDAAKLASEGVCAQVRVEEEMWVGEMAADPEDVPSQPMWVGSVAVRRDPPEPVAPAVEPAKPVEKKPWWRRLFS